MKVYHFILPCPTWGNFSHMPVTGLQGWVKTQGPHTPVLMKKKSMLHNNKCTMGKYYKKWNLIYEISRHFLITIRYSYLMATERVDHLRLCFPDPSPQEGILPSYFELKLPISLQELMIWITSFFLDIFFIFGWLTTVMIFW